MKPVRLPAQLEDISLCETIAGDLTFEDQDRLENFDLPCITKVGGDLCIWENDTLTSLAAR